MSSPNGDCLQDFVALDDHDPDSRKNQLIEGIMKDTEKLNDSENEDDEEESDSDNNGVIKNEHLIVSLDSDCSSSIDASKACVFG